VYDSAVQHEHAPRPLPLFLDLVRKAGERDPALARKALNGLALYARAPRSIDTPLRPAVARVRSASLRDCGGGDGPPLVMVPSLINPPNILDLDPQVSLAAAIARMGRRVLLVDWGRADERADLNVAGHVEHLLLPMMADLGERPALLGYCLGGTMAIAAAQLIPVERVVTLAAPWHFANYPDAARKTLQQIWSAARLAADSLGVLPMEVLQASFWSLDPHRTVAKYAELAALAPDSDEARRFVALEDWANEGEALPRPAAGELLEDFFERDVTGSGQWLVAGRRIDGAPGVPALHFTAARDRIAPAPSAPDGDRIDIPAGHVGMVVGRARGLLHEGLERFLRLAA